MVVENDDFQLQWAVFRNILVVGRTNCRKITFIEKL